MEFYFSTSDAVETKSQQIASNVNSAIQPGEPTYPVDALKRWICNYLHCSL